jgi:hypothetical protein
MHYVKCFAIRVSSELMLYPGTGHDFDDPVERRQGIKANADAKKDAIQRRPVLRSFAGEIIALELEWLLSCLLTDDIQ